MQLYTRIYTGTRYLRVALAFSLNSTVVLYSMVTLGNYMYIYIVYIILATINK